MQILIASFIIYEHLSFKTYHTEDFSTFETLLSKKNFFRMQKCFSKIIFE